MTFIEFDPDKFKEFKKAYEKHKDKDTFMFDGYQIVPEYAKYMIQYLEDEMQPKAG